MKNPILDRYSRTGNDEIIIDVTTTQVQDLYNNFDHNAPYVKKDLNRELADYLVESAIEIGSEPFLIRFRFHEPADPEVLARVTDSVRNYFDYMAQLQSRKLARMLRTSSIYLLAGMVLLVLSIILNRQLPFTDSVVFQIFAEGMTIAAWVSLWEALANLLVQWAPLKRQLNIHQHISKAKVVFD